MTQVDKNKNRLLQEILNLRLFVTKFEELVVLFFLTFLESNKKKLFEAYYKKNSKGLNTKDNLLYNQEFVKGIFSFDRKRKYVE